MTENIIWCNDEAYLEIEHVLCHKCPKERLESLACPCGMRIGLSNYFIFLGDKHFYCIPCTIDKRKVFNAEIDACKDLAEAEAVLARWRKDNETEK